MLCVTMRSTFTEVRLWSILIVTEILSTEAQVFTVYESMTLCRPGMPYIHEPDRMARMQPSFHISVPVLATEYRLMDSWS